MGYPIIIRELTIVFAAAVAVFLLLALTFSTLESRRTIVEDPLIEKMGSTGTSDVEESKMNDAIDSRQSVSRLSVRMAHFESKRQITSSNAADITAPHIRVAVSQASTDSDYTRSFITFLLLDLRSHLALLYGSLVAVVTSYVVYRSIAPMKLKTGTSATVVFGASGMAFFLISLIGLKALNNKGYGNSLLDVLLSWWPCSTIARDLRTKCEDVSRSKTSSLGSLRPKAATSVDIQFANLCLRLNSGTSKVLLDRVDGRFNSSSINAIMGPSGEPCLTSMNSLAETYSHEPSRSPTHHVG